MLGMRIGGGHVVYVASESKLLVDAPELSDEETDLLVHVTSVSDG